MFEVDMCFGMGCILECMIHTAGMFFLVARCAVLPFADPRVKRLESGGAQRDQHQVVSRVMGNLSLWPSCSMLRSLKNLATKI